MHCHALLIPLSGAPGFTNVCHLDKICNLTLDIKMHKYKYTNTNTNTNEHIQYKCANFAEWLHLFKLDRWSEKYTNIRSPWCSIHNAGFDDACIHDSTNYAYIIDAYIYDGGGGYPECYRGDGEEGLLQGDSRSMMHVSSDRLDACMMHDAHIF